MINLYLNMHFKLGLIAYLIIGVIEMFEEGFQRIQKHLSSSHDDATTLYDWQS